MTEYEKQKKYFESRKQLRVWVDAEKYERFRASLEQSGDSVYAAINRYIDEYLKYQETE